MKKRLNYILQFSKPHWTKFALLFTCVIVTIFIGSTFKFIFGKLIDEVITAKDMSKFTGWVLLYCGIFFVNQLLHLTLNISWANLMTKFLFDIRKAVFDKTLGLKAHALSNMHSGDLVSRMQKDVGEFMNFIHWNVFYLIGGILNLILALLYIAYMSVPMAAVALLMTPLSVFATNYFAKKIKPLARRYKEDEGLLASWLYEMLKGMDELGRLGATRQMVAGFTSKQVHLTRLKIRMDRVEVTAERSAAGIGLLGQLVLFLVAAYLVSQNQLTIGGVIACIGYFQTCVSAFNVLTQKITTIPGNLLSMDRVIELLEKEQENYDYDQAPRMIEKGNITFEDVHFNYEANAPVLEGLSLKVKAGETVALVGHSGAGKTTLSTLLQRFYEPQSGQILIDDVPLSAYPLYSLRRQIGVVQQDTVLLNATLRDNITLNQRGIDDSVVTQALEKAHLSEWLCTLPNGLDTLMGIQGEGVSGGQKQRIAIARIFLADPKILVFDEATSSLDRESERAIKSSWKSLSEGRTTLIIAHRLSTIIGADRIAVVSKGKIVGFDHHETLLNHCETYRALFESQHDIEMNGGAYASIF
jgi:ABC-type multidrug transport system fused ATPase/permease subunit